LSISAKLWDIKCLVFVHAIIYGNLRRRIVRRNQTAGEYLSIPSWALVVVQEIKFAVVRGTERFSAQLASQPLE
jgi:hypothetical protein